MIAATVIIPVYNAGAYLRAAVRSALAQTYSFLQVLIVDDGSTDGAVDGLPRDMIAGCRVLRQANAGKSVAMNRALREVEGDYYCILDADDEMHPTRVARQVAALESNPDVAAVFCGHQLLIGSRSIAPRRRAKSREECAVDIAHFRMPAHDPTGVFRMSHVRNLEYNASLRIAQGYDYVLRVGEQAPMIVLGETLYTYRVHVASITRADQSRRRRAAREVRKLACERRGLEFEAACPDEERCLSRRDLRVSCDCIEGVVDLCEEGKRTQAVRTGLICATLCPTHPHYYRALFYSLLPNALRRSIRPSERIESTTTRPPCGVVHR